MYIDFTPSQLQTLQLMTSHITSHIEYLKASCTAVVFILESTWW